MLKYKVAILNILRNYRRSLITLAAIVLGCASLILFGGFVASMYEGMRENLIRSQLGHIQIYAKGFNQYANSEPEKYLISQQDISKITEVISEFESVQLVAPRLNFSGLLSDSHNSIAVTGLGVDADNEELLSSAVSLVKGESLFPEDSSGALLGEGLFNALNSEVGDYLTLLSSTADGAINAVDIKITGVIRTGVKEVDSRLVKTNINLARDLLYTDSASRLVVLLDDTHKTQQVLSELSKAFDNAGLQLEMRTWSDLADYYHQVVALFDGVFGFIQIIVLFIVALSISNTMMMAVMERTKEIGTIRAMGGTPFEVISLFILESIFLGIIGSALGLIVGSLLANGITFAEWTMPRPPGSTQDYPVRVFVEIDVLFKTFLLGLSIAVISSIYPAVKASRLPVSNALRYV